MWNLLLKCYATEAEAITAAKRTTSLILPYMNSPTNIAGSYDVLVELLGEEAARDVCIRNPAVLGNDPAALRGCSAKDIQDSARLKEFIETSLLGGLRLWATAFVLTAAAGIAIALTAPASASAVTAELPAIALVSAVCGADWRRRAADAWQPRGRGIRCSARAALGYVGVLDTDGRVVLRRCMHCRSPMALLYHGLWLGVKQLSGTRQDACATQSHSKSRYHTICRHHV